MFKIFSISALITILIFLALHLLFPLPGKIEYSHVITDKKGEMIHAFLTKDDKWRMETALDEISPLLRQTIIHKEDKYFYHHSGVNPFAIARAFVHNIFHLKRTSGASTITMQVARALERRPRNYGNKLIEILRAWQLELKYNKNEILALYCNLLPYGGNIEGVKAASLLYFKKDPDHLSLAEITALSIIPNRPSSLVPGKHNMHIRVERDSWLKRFAKEGVFSTKQIKDALAEPFNVSRNSFPRLVPHLAEELKTIKSNSSHTFINLNIQLKTEQLVKDYTRLLKLKSINNAAVVIIDNEKHEVITYVGSSNFYDTTDGGQVNGINAVRQPGSTLKPFVYAMCIDEGLITPKSLFADVNVSYNGYSPENYDRKFNGNVTMEYALEHSLNIPAVRALNRLGTSKFISTLATCNFKQVKKDHNKLGLSLILGGCGTTLMELAALYSTLANNGSYVKPALTTSDRSTHSTQILSPAATFMINETLSKINRPDFPLNWQSTEHMPKIAWKTGTSYGRRDAWSIGYNKKYTVAVWAGNFSGTSIPDLSGAAIATPLLFKIFNTIDYDADAEWFAPPAECDSRIVCSETGMPPSDNCQSKVTDYFIPTVSSVAVCNNMKEEIISPDEGMSYCRLCMPDAGYKKKLFKIVSPELQRWSDEQGIAYERIPPHNAACEEIFRNGKPSIISPSAGFEYLLNRKNPEPLQLQCRAGNDVNRVYWYIDNRFYKSGDVKTPIYFVPSEGPVKISCTDDKGRNRDMWITVRFVEL